MTFTEFKKKHIINLNFPYYIGLRDAISKHWRKAFSRDNENDLVVTGHESVHDQPFKNLPPLAGKHASFKSFQKLACVVGREGEGGIWARVVSCPNSLPLPFQTPATQATIKTSVIFREFEAAVSSLA